MWLFPTILLGEMENKNCSHMKVKYKSDAWKLGHAFPAFYTLLTKEEKERGFDGTTTKTKCTFDLETLQEKPPRTSILNMTYTKTHP